MMRVTQSMFFNNAIANIRKQQARLLQAQGEATSGKRVQRPSDDPVRARRILDLRTVLASLEQFGNNRKTLNGFLHVTDTALQDIESLLLRAKNLTIRAASDTTPPATRALIAAEIGDLFEQALQIGNTGINGRYLFAGQANDRPPFSATATIESSATGLRTSGTLSPLAAGDLLINGLSVRATQATDDPFSTADSAASSLAIAAAINEAAAQTGVRATAATAVSLAVVRFGDLADDDLRINGVPVAGTVTDMASLVTAMNAAGVDGVVATATDATSLTLTAADGRNIQLQTDGQAAGGLAFADFDLAGGIALEQTARGTVLLTSKTAFTLGGLSPGNAGFRAGPVNLTARYSGDNGELRLSVAPAQTLPMNLAGSRFLLAHLEPNIERATPLTSLRQGQGISPGSIIITDRAGGTATVDLSAAVTVGEVLDTILAAPGINVTATINESGDGLLILDTNAAPVQDLSIANTVGGTTASELGIAMQRPGQIVGHPLRPLLTPSTPLGLLYRGRGVALTAIRIANGGVEADVDLRAATTINDVIAAINASGTRVTARLNAAGTALEVRSQDPSTVAIVTEVEGGTSAADLGIQGARDVLKTLGLLQEALQKNDRYALEHLLTSLDEGFRHTSTLRADIGARMQRAAGIDNNQAEFELNLAALLSQAEDADSIEVITRLSTLSAGLQATLAATARIIQPTLLDFLR